MIVSSFEGVFVTVEGEAYHAVVDQLGAAAKARPQLRSLILAEFSPPHPWLKLAVPMDEIPNLARRISESLHCAVVGLAVQTVVDAFGFWRFESGRTKRALIYGMAGDEERQWTRRGGSVEPWEAGVLGEEVDAAEAATAVFRHYDLPRYSDHRLRIGPAWPFRRFEVFW